MRLRSLSYGSALRQRIELEQGRRPTAWLMRTVVHLTTPSVLVVQCCFGAEFLSPRARQAPSPFRQPPTRRRVLSGIYGRVRNATAIALERQTLSRRQTSQLIK